MRTELLVNGSSDRSCTRGMINNNIHLIGPGCLRSQCSLTVQNRGLTHQSFHLLFVAANIEEVVKSTEFMIGLIAWNIALTVLLFIVICVLMCIVNDIERAKKRDKR